MKVSDFEEMYFQRLPKTYKFDMLTKITRKANNVQVSKGHEAYSLVQEKDKKAMLFFQSVALAVA